MEKMRTNVVLPRNLVKAVDRIVGKKKRSDFLAQAAQERLARITYSNAVKKAFGSWKDENYAFLRTESDVEEFLAGIRRPVRKRLGRKING